MSGDNGNWCLIESDPGVFTELIHNMGAQGVQVEELYDLDASTLRGLEPVYGLIFLFKWQSGSSSNGGAEVGAQAAEPAGDSGNVYFAQQIIQNACATQAILAVLLNRSEDIELGQMLENFRSFSADLPPDMRGLAMTNSDGIRDVHNSFVRPESFISEEKRPATESDDVFHFISYVPVGGRLYELDGLKPGPIDHGATDDWLESVGGVIQKRMSEYSQSEIRFNLMAVIGDRRKILGDRISIVDADISRLTQRLEALRLDSGEASQVEATQVESQIGELNTERAGLEFMVEQENGKFARYRFDNALRKHNFIPLVYQLVRGLAHKSALRPAMQRAAEAAKTRPRRREAPSWQ
ncbi:hypothetical protein H4R19_001202 [Coemansia spiralis]|nr:hypothetical protein H4R19_001202 [Coemansia spiralis]